MQLQLNIRCMIYVAVSVPTYRKAKAPHAKFKATFDNGGQQVEGKNTNGYRPEQCKPFIKPNKIVAQEPSQLIVWDNHDNADLEKPKEAYKDANAAENELGPGNQRVVVAIFRMTCLQIFNILFQQVNRLFKLIHGQFV